MNDRETSSGFKFPRMLLDIFIPAISLAITVFGISRLVQYYFGRPSSEILIDLFLGILLVSIFLFLFRKGKYFESKKTFLDKYPFWLLKLNGRPRIFISWILMTSYFYSIVAFIKYVFFLIHINRSPASDIQLLFLIMTLTYLTIPKFELK